MRTDLLAAIPGYAGIQESTARLRYLVFLGVCCALPFEMYFSSMFLGLLVILTLADISKAKLRAIPRQFWIFQGVYLLALAGYLPSLHRDQASFLLERQLAIFLFPVILPVAVPVSRQLVHGALWALSAGCVAALCILFGNALHTVLYEIRQPVSALFEGPFFNHQFSRPLGIHAGYLSLYIAFSGFFFLTALLRTRRWHVKALLIFCLLLFAAGLLFLAARTVLFTTVLVIVFLFPLVQLRRSLMFMLPFILICIVLAITISNVPYLRHRFTTELLYDISPVQRGEVVQYYNTEPRIERWKAGWELVERSPVFGYGTGDEIPMLKTRYAHHGLFISYLEDFNAHNQYLSYLIKNGFVGLIAFLGLMAYYSLLAIRRRDFLYMSFLALMLSSFYTENVLDANKGILFFAIFNTLLGYSLIVRVPDSSENNR